MRMRPSNQVNSIDSEPVYAEEDGGWGGLEEKKGEDLEEEVG